MKIDECFRSGLLRRTSPDMENAKRSLTLSMNNIEDAAENLPLHRYRVVVVSSYTAMFHAARAILFKDGIKKRSHECIPLYIKEHYRDLERYANILDAYRRLRHNAIYGLDFVLDHAEAQASLETAKDFLEKIKSVINKIE